MITLIVVKQHETHMKGFVTDVDRGPYIFSPVKLSVPSQALWCDMKWKPRRGLALDGHFVSGLMHFFTVCHFGYISEAVVVVSKAAGLIRACLLQLDEQGN